VSFGLSGVTVEMGGQPAIEGIDLDIERGAITAIIGPDGAGKSTVARTLVGLVSPSAGTMVVPPRDSIGYQPEAAGSWPDLTVAENLSFVAAAYGIPADSDRYRELLSLTGLGPAADRLAGQLSGGMRQKLAVAMAMLSRPELTVLDEPTTGLDPVSRADVWRLLARAAGEGTAVLATTTYLNEAERASHVVVLDQGRILVSGTAASIRASFPGSLGVLDSRPHGFRAWRRGNLWRVWAPEGRTPVGARVIAPDLEDVVTAAALARRDAR
jgi:ABC-2 type transport system ATP-binding protein